ncbi:MAG: sulfatase, partial [Candidatus Aminicenantia bacterium]
MKLKLFIWLIAFLFLLAQCSSKKSEKEFLRKLNFEFLSFKNYNSVSLVRLFDSSFIRRKKQKGTKPSIVSINQKVKSIEQSSSSVIEYYLEIPERSKLVFSAFSLKPVIFKISASTQEGGEDLIFSEKYVSGENPKLQQIELLPYQEKIVKLSFKLEGEGRGYWLEPKIIFKKEELNWDDYSRFWTELRKKAEKWNLIYIVLDAARPDHFSCYGYPKKTTPYIDQFSKESLIFDNAFSQAVYTLASTSSLFTGLYPISHYVVMDYQKLPDRFFTLAEAFSEKEYLTLAEISNPYVSSKFNMHQGFSFFKRNWKTEKIFLNSETKDLIKKENKRFFLYLHYTPPHAPYDPPLRFKKKFISSIRKTDIGLTEYLKKVEEGEIELKREDLNYLKNLYDANLNYVDYYVGRVIELLKKEGWYQNSVIIITSDHGEALYEHQKLQHNSTVYEEMIRIPLIIKFPPTANIEPQRISNLVEMIDLTATFFDLFNL